MRNMLENDFSIRYDYCVATVYDRSSTTFDPFIFVVIFRQPSPLGMGLIMLACGASFNELDPNRPACERRI